MKKRSLQVLSVWLLAHSVAGPAQAGPLPFTDMLPRTVLRGAVLVSQAMATNWGYGARENHFNDLIIEAVQATWSSDEHPLPPRLYKSLMAVESAFNPLAISRTGAAGLAQLTPDTARRFGLKLHERLDPNRAVPAGIAALEEKHRVILDPGNYYGIVSGTPKACAWGDTVAQAYEELGQPEGEAMWYLVLGAYNGGGGTVLRAMSYAYQKGLDPRDWDQIAGLPGRHLGTPLHAACCEVFGTNGGTAKAYELAAYPRKIMALYQAPQP